MYPRNAASPPSIAIGAVVQISDGAVQSAGITVYHRTSGTTETSGGGTTSIGATTGMVYYTPTQAETNYESFEVVAFKTGCIPVAQTIVTSKSSTAGYAGLDWGQVTNATTTVALTGTTIASTQKVDVDTIKTNPVVNGGTITFPTNSTLASTTNITAGTVTTATNVTTVNNLAAGVITAASIAADAITAAKVAADVGLEIADAVWDEATAGHTTAGTTGKALTDAGSAGDPWSTALPGAYGAGTAGSLLGRIPDIAAGSAGGLFIAGANAATTVNITGNITGNLSGSVGSVTGAVGSVTGNVGGNVTGSVGSVVGAVGSVTGNVGGSVASVTAGVTVTTNNDKTGYALSATGSAAFTEGYAALGAAATLPQLLYEVRALLAEKSYSGTTLTTKKLDGSTTAATYTLDDATTPSAITRAT